VTPAELFGVARHLVATKLPYMRSALTGCVAIESAEVDTMAMSERGVLVWNPEFVKDLKPQEAAGVVYHELLHWMLDHHARLGDRDPDMWNTAADLSIYPAVTAVFSLPADAYRPELFGWPSGETAEGYYARLTQRQQQSSKSGPGKPQQGQAQSDPGKGQGDSSSDRSADDSKAGEPEKVTQGKCGSAASNPSKGEPDKDSPLSRTPAQCARVRRAVAEAAKAAAQSGKGELPGELARWAEMTLAPPKVPWRTKLQHLARQAVTFRSGAQVYRFDGPSRRQAGLGYGAGKGVLPRMRAPSPKIVVAIDTSGSMGGDDLVAALREVRGILQAMRCPLELVACDAHVNAIGRVTRIEDVPALLKGGGGTNFRPVFELLEKEHPQPEIVIYMTDGDGCYPAKPGWAHVIWVLVGSYVRQPPWGDVVRVEDDNDKR